MAEMSTSDPLDRLAATIAARVADRAEGREAEASWTAKLLARGPGKCAEKFGEEAVEAIVAAVSGDRAALTAEAADVVYHLLVMCAARGVTLADIRAELDRRAGLSGIAEKAARGEGRT
jgi:phosphoribosyl-ATP pyrophosphohydrolase